ncbi:MAG TPA: sulfocyanin-like copper-binding protein [Gemmatimonadales bacterium]|nr:sulfocyanin-like copper-binding protein [Gemmatimonadales bacterium]
MSVSIGITGRVPLIGVASVLLAACSSAADRPASRDTTAMTTAAAPDTATSTSRTAVETSGTVTDSTTAIRTQSAGVSQTPPPKPRVRPSIDPGRKSTTTSSGQAAPRDTAASAPSDTAAQPPSGDTGDSAQPSTAASGQDKYLKWDAGSKTATFELQAGPFTFNGFSSGGGTLSLPPNANVVINFINKDGTPHSAEVIPGEGAIPNQSTDPAIPRAYTTKALEGLPQEGSDNMKFTVPASGTYRIFCGVPGHGLSGMWIWMKIDPAAKTPSFGATKK